MKIVFLSLLYERENEEFYKNKIVGMMPNASNTFQYAILDGLKENNKIDDLYVINSLPVGIYKSCYDELYLKEQPFCYDGRVIGKTIKCINYNIIKQISRYVNTYDELKEYVKKHKDEKIMIISYNVYAPYIKACYKLVKKYKNVSFCPIITDMPGEFGMLPSGWLKRKYVLWQGKKTLKRLKYAEKFVLLTKHMKEVLHINDNYIIMEGIYSSLDRNNCVKGHNNKDKKIILYTGSLNKNYGILTLIQAFNYIKKDDLEFWICGGVGDAEKVKEEASINPNIKFFGDLPRGQVIKYQRSADLLVNPRQNKGEYVKYSFPSKTMEYLSSGKPVYMFKLDGIPDEYDKYLNYFSCNDPLDMAKNMEDILYNNYEQAQERALQGQEFILKYKNSKAQVKRILDFFEE